MPALSDNEHVRTPLWRVCNSVAAYNFLSQNDAVRPTAVHFGPRRITARHSCKYGLTKNSIAQCDRYIHSTWVMGVGTDETGMATACWFD